MSKTKSAFDKFLAGNEIARRYFTTGFCENDVVAKQVLET